MIQVQYCGYHTHNPDRELIYRPNGTDSYLFLLVLSPMEFRFPGQAPLKAEPGACVLYTPGCYQHYQAQKEFYNSYVHFYYGSPEEIPGQIPLNTLFYPAGTEEIHWLLKKVYQEFLNKLPDYEEMLHLYLRQLLLLVSRGQAQVSIPEEHKQDIYPELLALRGQMLHQCEQPWNVDQLCKILNLGKSQFFKYYKQFFHCSPKDELIQARLHKACFLMTNEAATIREAAFDSGFQNINHFNRLFRKTYGCTPGEYRTGKKSLLDGLHLPD